MISICKQMHSIKPWENVRFSKYDLKLDGLLNNIVMDQKFHWSRKGLKYLTDFWLWSMKYEVEVSQRLKKLLFPLHIIQETQTLITSIHEVALLENDTFLSILKISGSVSRSHSEWYYLLLG